jgi:hypothetical protein
MKTITPAIDDEFLNKARIVAAHKDTTVNAMVRDDLTEVAGRDESQAEAGNRSCAPWKRRRAAWRRTESSTARKPMSGEAFLGSNTEVRHSANLNHEQKSGRVRCENPFRSN